MNMRWEITIQAVPPSLGFAQRMAPPLLVDLRKRWWNLIREALRDNRVPAATGRRRIDVTVWTASEPHGEASFQGGCLAVLLESLRPATRRGRRGFGLILDEAVQWLELGTFQQIPVSSPEEERTLVILTDCQEALTPEHLQEEAYRWALRCRAVVRMVLADYRCPEDKHAAREGALRFIEDPLPGALKAFEVSNA